MRSGTDARQVFGVGRIFAMQARQHHRTQATGPIPLSASARQLIPTFAASLLPKLNEASFMLGISSNWPMLNTR